MQILSSFPTTERLSLILLASPHPPSCCFGNSINEWSTNVHTRVKSERANSHASLHHSQASAGIRAPTRVYRWYSVLRLTGRTGILGPLPMAFPAILAYSSRSGRASSGAILREQAGQFRRAMSPTRNRYARQNRAQSISRTDPILLAQAGGTRDGLVKKKRMNCGTF